MQYIQSRALPPLFSKNHSLPLYQKKYKSLSSLYNTPNHLIKYVYSIPYIPQPFEPFPHILSTRLLALLLRSIQADVD